MPWKKKHDDYSRVQTGAGYFRHYDAEMRGDELSQLSRTNFEDFHIPVIPRRFE
jgi:hypothetical protein